jgi:MFS family permease
MAKSSSPHAPERLPASPASATLIRWRAALFVLFAVNGIGVATWASRIPEIAHGLGIGVAQTGALVTGAPAGAIVAILLSSHVIHFLGSARTMRIALICAALGLVMVGVAAGVLGNYALALASFVFYGFANASCGIVLNIEAAESDRAGQRTLMPMFHAVFSMGTFVGAGVGTFAAVVAVPLALHFTGAAALLVAAAIIAVGWMPAVESSAEARGKSTVGARMGVWLERRTLLIGLILLGTAFTEGTANNWLALALVEERSFTPAAGAAYLAAFTGAMTVGRLVGGALVDRIGRVAALRWALSLAAVGLLAVALFPSPVVIAGGVVAWGLGASLGYPLGMSAAADNPINAAARVSAVAAVGALAFLLGPSIIGFVGEHTSLLVAFSSVVLLVAVALCVSGAARPLAVDGSDNDMAEASGSESL